MRTIIQINGNSDSSIEGAFYFPRAGSDVSTAPRNDTKCLQLVSKRVNFSGNSGITNQLPGGFRVPAPSRAKR